MSTYWRSQVIDLFLVLAILSLFATTIAKKNHNSHHPAATAVHVINGLPKSSEAMHISCSSKNTSLDPQGIGAGKEYHWRVEVKALYVCFCVWRHFFQKWQAFQPRRDQNHRDVYWVIKEDGFYLGWDNSTWVRKAVWETE